MLRLLLVEVSEHLGQVDWMQSLEKCCANNVNYAKVNNIYDMHEGLMVEYNIGVGHPSRCPTPSTGVWGPTQMFDGLSHIYIHHYIVFVASQSLPQHCSVSTCVRVTQHLSNVPIENIYNMDEKGLQLGVRKHIAAIIDRDQNNVYNLEDRNCELVTLLKRCAWMGLF